MAAKLAVAICYKEWFSMTRHIEHLTCNDEIVEYMRRELQQPFDELLIVDKDFNVRVLDVEALDL